LRNLPKAYKTQQNARRKKWPLHKLQEDGEIRAGTDLDWPEFKALISDFPGITEYAHISCMDPGSVLRVHRDGYGKYSSRRPMFPLFNRTLRFHIPLATNDQTRMYCDGQFYTMKSGECWMLNNFCQHAAINNHATASRYHLILDVQPNSETMKLVEDAEQNLGIDDAEFFERHWPEHLIQNH